MQSPYPSSVLSLYFSKENIGVACFQKQSQIQCTIIQFYIYSTAQLINKLVYDKNPTFILTNQDRHHFLLRFHSSIKIIKIDERGLEDDIIQNNLSLLKINIEKGNIQNKNQYIKMMREHSESIGLLNQKYRALGMLIYYLLNSNQIGTASKICLNQIKYFHDLIFQHLQISNSELQALEIIKEQVHPSFIKGKGRSKQGFSILSLYETPMSSIGSKKILKHIFRNPTYNEILLESRYHLIYWIKKYCNDYKNLSKVFRFIHNVETILHRFAQSKVEVDDWRKIAKTLESMIIIHKIIEEKIKGCFQQPLPQLLDAFFKLIKWEQIAKLLSSITSVLNLEDGTINKGVDPELDELKKTYDNLPHFLTLYARQQNWDDQYRIVFMAQIGYLVRVPHQKQIRSSQKQSWSLQFVKNSGKFYSNQLTSMLDNDFGDIYGEISDRQKKIYFELQNIVSESNQIIERAYWKICQFQCFVGISIISNGMSKPKLSSEAFILSKSWHLLLAQTAIQNNAFSFNQTQAPKKRVYNSQQNLVNTNYSNRVMLITGPNGSGKTVYMKQVSIIIFLAHIGLYVPAQFAQIPLVDKIILIQSKKSIYRMQNGFQSEMASLGRILAPNMLTNKSLILIDELGSSIDRILSKKILITLLKFICDPQQSKIQVNYQLTRQGDSFKIPLVLAITHLADLISSSLVEQSYYLRYLTLDMQKQETYLYKIKPGIVKRGYGIQCAKSFMDETFIRRAQQFWRQIKFRQ